MPDDTELCFLPSGLVHWRQPGSMSLDTALRTMENLPNGGILPLY